MTARPLVVLPPALAEQDYALRPEGEADVPFLRRLYASTRAQELAAVPWSDAQKQAFLDQQFDAQRLHYRTQIADCQFYVIERVGAPVARLYLQQRVTNLHIVDISVVPEARGAGFGTALLTAVIDTARGTSHGVGIFVERMNPAMRLYRRLGFVPVADDGGVHIEMERPCGGAPS